MTSNKMGEIFVLRYNIRTQKLNSRRECGEAIDPMSGLYYRLESSLVLVKDESSSISRHCQASESVIGRSSTRLASTPNPSSSHVSSPIYSIPISPKARSYLLSGSSSDASSMHDGDHPEPPFEANLPPASPMDASISKTSLTIAMEEAENNIHANTDELMTMFDVVDVN